jgi:hypothetical protein
MRGVQTPAEAAPMATCVAVAMHIGHISFSAATAVLRFEVESRAQAAVRHLAFSFYFRFVAGLKSISM